MPAPASSGVERGIRVAAAFASDPFEAVERARDQIAERRERRRTLPSYDADAAWAETLRKTIGAGRDAADEFDDVWRGVEAAFAQKQLPFVRGAVGGWDDGDPALARAAWYVVRELRPGVVVETGVGRGVTTRVILEALARNG